jgi:hypothetical protein
MAQAKVNLQTVVQVQLLVPEPNSLSKDKPITTLKVDATPSHKVLRSVTPAMRTLLLSCVNPFQTNSSRRPVTVATAAIAVITRYAPIKARLPAVLESTIILPQENLLARHALMDGSVLEMVLLPQSVLRARLVNLTILVAKPVPLVCSVQPVDMMTSSNAPTEPTLLARKLTAPCAQLESNVTTSKRLVSLAALENTVLEVLKRVLIVLQVSNAATSLSQSHARLVSTLLEARILAISVLPTRSVAAHNCLLRTLAPLQDMLKILKVLIAVAYV